MPGEQCQVALNRTTSDLEQQISTTGVFKERTKAVYSNAYGDFYQLLANDNFKVEFNGDENSYVDFLVKKYQEHIDSLNSHPQWTSTVRAEALRTLNNKMIDRIEDPAFWLGFCANLRHYSGSVAPKSLSDESKKRAYEVVVKEPDSLLSD